MTVRTQREISDAVIALRAWLISQGLIPAEGFMVFCRMMAWCMVDKSTKHEDLAKGIDAIAELLEWEIGVMLSNRQNQRSDLAP